MAMIQKGQLMLRRCDWEETPIQLIPDWPFVIPSCLPALQSSAGVDKQVDRILLLI